MVNVQNGEVYDGPFGVLPKGTITFGAFPGDQTGITYRLDSSLLIAKGCPNEKDCSGYYYLWSGNQFKLLAKDGRPTAAPKLEPH